MTKTKKVPELSPRAHLIHNRDEGYTIAYQILGPVTGGYLVRAAEALVSPYDNFNRKIGRAVAVGRLAAADRESKKPDGRTIDHVYETVISSSLPTTGAEWREFDSTVVAAVDPDCYCDIEVEVVDDEDDDLPF